MTKKGPLNKTERFYIKHHYRDSTVEDLAKELDRPLSVVRACFEKCKKEDEDNEVFNVQNQFHHHKGSTVMTENASNLSDALRTNKPKTRPSCITSIKK
jgi:hypothetical protein